MFVRPTRVLVMPLLAGSLFWFNSAARGDDSSMPQPVSAEQITDWIHQLDAELFAARSEASRNLQAAGRAAFSALAQAATGDSRETRMRALEILRKHFEEGDEGTKQAAREVLEKIAAGPHEAAAARAKEVLDPKPDPPAMLPPIFAIPQLQIQVNAFGGGQVQRVRIANGVKQVEAEDGKRKVKISEDPAQGISVEVTEEKDGQQTTTKVQAKSVEELKKNHPEAHQIYQKFGRQLGGIQIQAGALQAGLMPAPAKPAGMGKQTAARLLAASRQLLENSLRQLEQARGEGDAAQPLDESIKRLKGIAQQLEEEERKLSQP